MSSTEEVSKLWNLFKQGDWNAYTRLYNEHYALLNNYGYKFTKETNLIEDAIQDLFIALWTNRSQLNNPISVKNYLYKALRTNLFRKIKIQSRFTVIQEDESMPFDVSFDQQMILEEEESILRRKIKSVVNTLPPRQQEIVFLRFYEDFDYTEIADIMDITIASTYKLLYKALHNLEVAFNA